jgi:hypothetical protein
MRTVGFIKALSPPMLAFSSVYSRPSDLVGPKRSDPTLRFPNPLVERRTFCYVAFTFEKQEPGFFAALIRLWNSGQAQTHPGDYIYAKC